MRITDSLPLALLLLGIGCGETARHEDRETPAAPPVEADASHGSEQGDVVRIDPAMLRDLRLTTAPAEARGGGDEVVALGEARVNEDTYAEVGPPIPSRVARLMASPGDLVRAGQPLVALRSAELGQARADHQEARARADLARQVLVRKRALGDERIAPRREVEEAEAEAQAAEASLRAALGRLQALGAPVEEPSSRTGTDPSEFTLTSPLSGTVLSRDAVRGQLADPSRPLFRIADTTRLWVVVQVFERDALRVRRGGGARVVFAALPGRSFPGRVTLVGEQVDSAARTIPVRVEVENGSGLLRPGMSATASMPLDDGGARLVAVPAASMQRFEEGWCVFIPVNGDTFEIRSVGRGRDLGGEVEVVSGLAAGETVVVEGAFLLKAHAEKERGEGGEHDH